MFGFGTGELTHSSQILKLWFCFCSSQHEENFVFVVFLENKGKFFQDKFIVSDLEREKKKSFMLISKVYLK